MEIKDVMEWFMIADEDFDSAKIRKKTILV
jgi:hypothetical protein